MRLALWSFDMVCWKNPTSTGNTWYHWSERLWILCPLVQYNKQGMYIFVCGHSRKCRWPKNIQSTNFMSVLQVGETFEISQTESKHANASMLEDVLWCICAKWVDLMSWFYTTYVNVWFNDDVYRCIVATNFSRWSRSQTSHVLTQLIGNMFGAIFLNKSKLSAGNISKELHATVTVQNLWKPKSFNWTCLESSGEKDGSEALWRIIREYVSENGYPEITWAVFKFPLLVDD